MAGQLVGSEHKLSRALSGTRAHSPPPSPRSLLRVVEPLYILTRTRLLTYRSLIHTHTSPRLSEGLRGFGARLGGTDCNVFSVSSP